MSDLITEDIRVIKLTTGEVIIGYQGNLSGDISQNPELDNYILMRSPYEIEYEVLESEDGQRAFNVNCSKWLPFIEDDVSVIQKHNIIAIGMPDEQLLNCYTSLLQIDFLGGVYEDEET